MIWGQFGDRFGSSLLQKQFEVSLESLVSDPKKPAVTGKNVPLFREDRIIEQSGAPEKKIIALWHRLCREVLGHDIEVIIVDRTMHPNTADFEGELNTGYPQRFEFGPAFVLLLQPHDGKFAEIDMAHELGHGILKLQGFVHVIEESDRTSDIGVLLSSLATHVPLYELMRTFGFDSQGEIDRRAASSVISYGSDEDPRGTSNRIRDALYLADDLFHCSTELSQELTAVLQKHRPRTWKYVDGLLKTRRRHDLAAVEGNRSFILSAMQNLNLGPGWRLLDEELEGLRKIAHGV